MIIIIDGVKHYVFDDTFITVESNDHIDSISIKAKDMLKILIDEDKKEWANG